MVTPPGADEVLTDEVLNGSVGAGAVQAVGATTCPGWLGERLDVGWAIDVLHPLATREATLRRLPKVESSALADWAADTLEKTRIIPFDPRAWSDD
jgi:hypothetical protein